MDHQPVAGRETAALKDIVQHQEDSHDDDHGIDKVRPFGLSCQPMAEVGTETECVIQQRTDTQPDNQMPSGVGTVGNKAVDELRHTIDDAHQRKDNAETGVRDAIGFAQRGHGKGEVLAYEIEHGIAYHRTDDDSPLPVTEAVLGFHGRGFT